MDAPKQMLAVFMPARNEKKNIGKNVDVLKEGIQNGKIDYAVIVIDGSTDRTAEIAFTKLGLSKRQIIALTERNRGTLVLQDGFVIIYHKKPEGKGRNFWEAVFTLKGRTNFFKNPNSVLVDVDADAVNLTVRKITGIAAELSRKGLPMILGKHLEKTADTIRPWNPRPESTGFRAIKATSLKPMLQMKKYWVRVFPRGFGMDYALNMLILEQDYLARKKPGKFDRSDIPVSHIKLLHEKPGKHGSDYAQYQRRWDARIRWFRDKPIHLYHPGPENLAFHERAKRKKLV